MHRWITSSLLLALIFIAARPLWLVQSFYSDDGLLHLFRVFALDRTIRQGIAYPRWLPDLALGYGYPMFNYYPPLAEYVVEAFHILGFGLPTAMQLTFVAIIAAAVLGAYVMGIELYGRERGPLAGILTAAAYVFFPYFIIDIYVRGANPEALAVALVPWLVFSVHRVLKQKTAGAIALAALLFALTFYAHSLTVFILAPFLGAFVLWQLAELPSANRPHAVMRLSIAMLIGAGLSAFYWLPFVTELSMVKMGVGIDDILVAFQSNFLSPSNLIQPSPVYQYQPTAPFSIGLVPVVLGTFTFGLALIAQNSLRERSIVLFFGATALVSGIMMIEPTKNIWLAVPLSTMVQFPWRISVLVGLGLAIAIAALPLVLSHWVQALTSKTKWRIPERTITILEWIIVAVASGGLIWSAIAKLAPQNLFFPSDDLTLAQAARFEAYSGFIGTTTWGEYLPKSVAVPELLYYRTHENKTVGRTDAEVTLLHYDATRRAFAVSTRGPISFSLRTLYFSDWRATVDDQPTATYPSTPVGLLTVDVPAGEHRVVFSATPTTIRHVSTGLFWLSGLGLAILIGWAIRRREQELQMIVPVMGCVIGLITLITFTALLSQPAPLNQTRKDISQELSLVGVRIDDARLDADTWHLGESRNSLHLQVYWHVKQSLEDKPFLWRLVDNAGHVWTQHEQLSRYGTGFPGTWVPNEIVEDHFDLPFDPGMPAGKYFIQVAYGEKQNLVTMGAVVLEQAVPQSTPVQIAHQLDARLGPSIRLLGFDAPQFVRAGEKYPVALYWQTDRNVYEDYFGFVQLLDVNHQVGAKHDSIPGGGLSPITLWVPGRTVPVYQELQLPAEIEPGVYRLITGLYSYPSLKRLPVTTAKGMSPDDVVVLAEVKIPIQATTATPQHLLQASLGTSINLLGYDLSIQDSRGNTTASGNQSLTARQGQKLALKFYWQARARIDNDYKVFVQLLDANGKLAAQLDRLPRDGKYPTRIWDSGETITDDYLLPLENLAPGRYTLVAGMYSPETGERLVATEHKGNELRDRRIEIGSVNIVAP